MRTSKRRAIVGSFVRHFLRSYVLVVVITIAVVSVAVAYIVNVVRAQSEMQAVSDFAAVRDTITRQFGEVKTILDTVSMNPNLTAFLQTPAGREPSYFYGKFELVRQLKPHAVSSDLVRTFLVYGPRKGVVVTPDSVFDQTDFFGEFFVHEGLSRTAWQAQLLEPDAPVLLPRSRVEYLGQWFEAVAYSPGRNQYQGRLGRGTIVAYLDAAILRATLGMADTLGEGGVALVDSEGGIVLAGGGAAAQSRSAMFIYGVLQAVDLSELTEGVLERRIVESEPMTLYVSPVADGAVRFVAALPETATIARIRTVRRDLLVFLSAALLLGLAVSLLVSLRQWAPLREVAGLLSRDDGGVSAYDWESVGAAIRSVLDDREGLKDRLAAQAPMLKHMARRALLTGDYGDDRELERIVALLEGEFACDADHYCVVLVRNEDNVSGGAEQVPDSTLLTVVLEEALRSETSIAASLDYVDQRTVAAVLSSRGTADDLFSAVSNVASAVTHTLRSAYGGVPSIGVGEPQDSAGQIFRGYRHAARAVESSRAVEHPVWHADLPPAPHGRFDVEAEARLIRMALLGRTEAAADMLKELVGTIPADIPAENEILYQLRHTRDRIAAEAAIQNAEWSEASENSEHSSLCRVPEQILWLTRQIREARSERRQELFSRIVSYLERSFPDPDLTLASAAETFGLTENYISAFFKGHANEGFSHYLETLRIEAAAVALRDSERAVKRIAIDVGYANDKSFRRAFKRRTGLSPAQYRAASADPRPNTQDR